MKKVYLDTSILIASHMPGDSFFKSSRRIYDRLAADLEGFTSPLSLIEVAGIVSSRLRDFKPQEVCGGSERKLDALSPVEMARLITYRIMTKEGLRIFHIPGDAEVKILRKNVMMPTIFSHALIHALHLGLRAFDACHFATAYDIVKLYREPLSFFVSNDGHFLRSRAEIGRLLDLTVVSSEEFASIER